MRCKNKVMPSLFFYPKTVAIIGATADPTKFGNALTKNILKNKNLQNEIFLISRSSKEICGSKCYRFIHEVPNDIDLAIVLVPASVVDLVVDQCIKKSVKRIIIITAGFGEIDDLGKKVESEIAKKCNAAGIRVMGPNCVGIQNLDIGLNASFIQTFPRGNISMISQSGSISCASFYKMSPLFLGCSKFASIGNQVDVSFNEILTFFKEDKNTKIIILYIEAVTDGRALFNVIKEITPIKPIIILKGGKSRTGMKAASSHTGSIATNYKILKAAFQQAGAIICESFSDYVTAIKTLRFLPTPKGKRIAILTNSGGTAVLFSDYVEKFGFQLANFSEGFKEKIFPYLNPLAKRINPLDMIAGSGKTQYYEITKAMLEDPDIDIVVACVVIPPFLEMKRDEHFKGIIQAWNDTERIKTLIPLIIFGNNFKELNLIAEKEKICIFETPQEASFAIKLLIERKDLLERKNISNIKN